MFALSLTSCQEAFHLTLHPHWATPHQVRKDLSRARDAFVMASDLHLTYLVTPARNDELAIDWSRWGELCERRVWGRNRLLSLRG